MITFLPSTDFEEVAKCLDDKRLGAQRYEAWSILKWLRNPDDYPKLVRAGYCLMWKGYEGALVRYTNAMLTEWASRGFRNKDLRPFDPERGLDESFSSSSTQKRKRRRRGGGEDRGDEDGGDEDENIPLLPPWMGEPTLHAYHRHALVAKLPEHYGESGSGGLGWSEDGSAYNGSYPWPVPAGEVPGLDPEAVTSSSTGWFLRWPRSTGLPPVPVSLSTKERTATTTTTEPPKKMAAAVTPPPEPLPHGKRRRAFSGRTRTDGDDDGGGARSHSHLRRSKRLRGGGRRL